MDNKLDERIKLALKKAAEFLCSEQKPDGSWVEETKYNEPSTYRNTVVATSHCIYSLIFAGESRMSNVLKGLYFCANSDVKPKDPVDYTAWKLLALKLLNIQAYEDQKNKLKDHLYSENKEGFWPKFPTTFNLTNFSCVLAMEGLCDHVLERTRRWFLKNKAKDGVGWGMDNKAAESEVTFTCNVGLALLASGESPLHPDLQTAKEFLETRQAKNGGWCSTKLTIDEPTTYATGLALLTLMRLSKDPFNEQIQKGVKFLLKTQLEEGHWPLVEGDKEVRYYYPAYYATKPLAFYIYLKENWNKPSIKLLRQHSVEPQVITEVLYKRFIDGLKNNLRERFMHSVMRSRVLGLTKQAVTRRTHILKILAEEGSKEVSKVIDSLKTMEQYKNLSKKSHLTQIKSDLEFLRDLKVIGKTEDDEYYSLFKLKK